MKTSKLLATAFLALALLFNSGCATIFFGTSPDNHCKTTPAPGQPTRQVHIGALIFDIFFGLLPLVVDFADGAIYQPCASGGSAPTHTATPH